MNGNLCSPAAKSAENRPHPPAYRQLLVRAVWIVIAVTPVIFFILLSIGHIRLSQIGSEIVVVFVYSAFIATTSILLLTRVASRYTVRFPRMILLIEAALLVCTAAFGTFAGDLLLQFLGIVSRGGFWSEFRESLPFSIVITLMFGLGISTYETLRYKFQAATLELRTRQVEQERAYKLLAEARLSSLESRIHPHFLFNTLNSIAALIHSDPLRAEDMVGKLASLLRFSLNANQNGLVRLGQELKIVRDYLEIEKVRFGGRIRYEIDVDEIDCDVKVPPLALQSLVENSVKHVASQRPQGASIRIAGSLLGARNSGRFRLEVIDDGPGFSLDAIAPGHGLGNLIDRIELLFGDEGQLEVVCGGGRTTVVMTFPYTS